MRQSDVKGYPGVKFQAMNTQIAAIGKTETQLAYWQRPIVQQFASLEQSASRFLADSELTRLNDHPIGQPFKATIPFFRLLQYAWELAVLTDFRFQPFVGSALRDIGYDRSFELLSRHITHTEPVRMNHLPVIDSGMLEFNEQNWTIRKHSPLALDLGGIGKGWAVDQAASLMRDTFQIQSGLVDAGGDIQTWSDHDPWCIGIQHPEDENEEILQIWVNNAGIATSNVLFRSWERDGYRYHHIIDGHSFKSAQSDIIQATVIAPTTAEADAAAKVLCMLPSHQVYDWMMAHFPKLAYIFVKKSGELVMNRQLGLYVERVV